MHATLRSNAPIRARRPSACYMLFCRDSYKQSFCSQRVLAQYCECASVYSSVSSTLFEEQQEESITVCGDTGDVLEYDMSSALFTTDIAMNIQYTHLDMSSEFGKTGRTGVSCRSTSPDSKAESSYQAATFRTRLGHILPCLQSGVSPLELLSVVGILLEAKLGFRGGVMQTN